MSFLVPGPLAGRWWCRHVTIQYIENQPDPPMLNMSLIIPSHTLRLVPVKEPSKNTKNTHVLKNRVEGVEEEGKDVEDETLARS
jgi:hypothetical protein